MRILLFTPPMIDLHTPYPAAAYLTGFLRSRGFDARQADAAIETVLRLFSRDGLAAMREELAAKGETKSASKAVAHFLDNSAHYIRTVEPAVRFLQQRDPTLALRIVDRDFFPESPRANEIWAYENSTSFGALRQLLGEGSYERALQEETIQLSDPLSLVFGSLGLHDRARYLATIFLLDLAEVIQAGLDPAFELSRYGEKLAESSPTFDPIADRLAAPPTIVDRALAEIALRRLREHEPDVVCLTVPFPGNAYGAFRIAKTVRESGSKARIILGGGYVNTELRELSDPRVFDHVDYVTLDDGEKPLLCILENLKEQRGEDRLFRTFVRRSGKVALVSDPREHDIPHKDCGTPAYDGIDMGQYLATLEGLTPLHQIWSSGRWLKLTLAHGCYWKKCAFCDTGLDYVGRYDPASADLLLDRMEALIRETGQTGFHFVDEAAPPAVLRALSERILERGLTVTWWGNVRFDKAFTPELCELLARAGCIAVTGGLEVASDRLLRLMNKGVSVEQVARVTSAFRDAGIFVHAYLMYAFPSQTLQETVDALECVRQLFRAGCVSSGVWHRFIVTAYSPIAQAPEKYGLRLLKGQASTFSRYIIRHADEAGVDHDRLGECLRQALHHYMHDSGIELDVQHWFKGMSAPRPTVPADLVEQALR